MKKISLILMAIVLFSISCNQDKKGCDFHKWEITAKPLNNKGVVSIVKYNDFYVELPFKEGDTITRWFDDREYNYLVQKCESLGKDVSDLKFKVIRIKKHCYNQ